VYLVSGYGISYGVPEPNCARRLAPHNRKAAARPSAPLTRPTTQNRPYPSPDPDAARPHHQNRPARTPAVPQSRRQARIRAPNPGIQSPARILGRPHQPAIGAPSPSRRVPNSGAAQSPSRRVSASRRRPRAVPSKCYAAGSRPPHLHRDPCPAAWIEHTSAAVKLGDARILRVCPFPFQSRSPGLKSDLGAFFLGGGSFISLPFGVHLFGLMGYSPLAQMPMPPILLLYNFS